MKILTRMGDSSSVEMTRDELREAFEEKLSKWKHQKGGDGKNE